MPIEPFFERLFRSFTDDEDDDFFNVGQFPQHGGWGRQFAHRSSSSSYEIHRDEKQVQVDVDVPGVARKDLKVEVLTNVPGCVVQWSGSRKNRGREDESSASTTTKFANRLRLGRSVDCEKLAANLSHGVLRLTVPVKERDESFAPRTIRVTERDE